MAKYYVNLDIKDPKEERLDIVTDNGSEVSDVDSDALNTRLCEISDLLRQVEAYLSNKGCKSFEINFDGGRLCHYTASGSSLFIIGNRR